MIFRGLLVIMMLAWFGGAQGDAAFAELDGTPMVAADDIADPDPEEAEGDFDERARTIQQWLQKRELERIDQGLSHQYERPRAIDDEDSGGESEYGGYRRAGRGLFVRLRRPRPSFHFHHEKRVKQRLGARGSQHLSARQERRSGRGGRAGSVVVKLRPAPISNGVSRHSGGSTAKHSLSRSVSKSPAKLTVRSAKKGGKHR